MTRTLGSIALSLLLAAPAGAADWTGKVLRLGVDPTYPPLEYKQPDGRLAGFGIEIGEALCAELRARCEWVESNWDGIIPALLSRKIDAIVSSMTITPKRAQHIAFTDRVSNAPSRLVVRRGSALLPDAESLRGKRVGVGQGSNQEAYAKAEWAAKGVRVVSYQNQDQVYADLVMGLLGASAKLAANRPLRALASGYTTLIRSVPDLVIMLLLFFSLQILLNRVTDALGIGQVDIDPFAAGCVTLAFIYGAYFTETFRGAFQAVPAGQVEAAQAYGMGRWRVFRRVLLPQMLRYALPGIGNNWQVLVKSTALVSIIGLGDLVKATQDAGKGTLQFFHFTLVCGLIYLAITAISNAALLWLERRSSLGVRRPLP